MLVDAPRAAEADEARGAARMALLGAQFENTCLQRILAEGYCEPPRSDYCRVGNQQCVSERLGFTHELDAVQSWRAARARHSLNLRNIQPTGSGTLIVAKEVGAQACCRHGIS